MRPLPHRGTRTVAYPSEILLSCSILNRMPRHVKHSPLEIKSQKLFVKSNRTCDKFRVFFFALREPKALIPSRMCRCLFRDSGVMKSAKRRQRCDIPRSGRILLNMALRRAQKEPPLPAHDARQRRLQFWPVKVGCDLTAPENHWTSMMVPPPVTTSAPPPVESVRASRSPAA